MTNISPKTTLHYWENFKDKNEQAISYKIWKTEYC